MRCTASTRRPPPTVGSRAGPRHRPARERRTGERPERLDGIGHRESTCPSTGRARQPRRHVHRGGSRPVRLYAWMLGEHGAALTDAVRLIADSVPIRPVHCTAGKDRPAW
ncbi:hypothetical protein GS940_24280 [Rhodococcus hoagii]|nr:hypothetical protein [Prescottella equi]